MAADPPAAPATDKHYSQKASKIDAMSNYKSVQTSQYQASKQSLSKPISSQVIKADHGIMTAYNPRGLPLGPGGVAASHKYENKVALKRVDCRRQMGLDPMTVAQDYDKGQQDNIYAGPSLTNELILRSGALLPVNPSYTMPKDTQQSMLAIYEKRSRATPAPHDHHTDLSWTSVLGKFGAGSTRTTFCDDAIAHSKKVPSPSKYDPDTEQWGKYDEHERYQKIKKVRLGKMEAAEGVNYLSDAEFRGLTQPGPLTYTPDTSVIQKNSSSRVALKIPSKGLSKEWRYQKDDRPGSATYNLAEASMMQSNKRTAPKCQFSKIPVKRFTDLACEAGAKVPGVGQHQVEDCFKKLSRPPSSLRRRRC